jgi:hypothetical protein
MPRADVDDDDAAGDRPRKKKKKFKSRKESGSGAMLWVVLGIVFVLLAGGGILAYFLINSSGKNEVAKNDTGAATSNNLPGRNIGRPNRGAPTPDDGEESPPNRPGSGPGRRPGQPPMPPNMGGGNFNPFASFDISSLDFGDLPAKQASQVDAVKYLPANSTTIGGFDFANVFDAPPLKAFQNPQSDQTAVQTFGVAPQEIENMVFGTKESIFDGIRKSGDAGEEHGVAVIKTKRPYDQAKVRENLHAGEAQLVEGKNVYTLPGKFKSLYMPSDRIIILAVLPEGELAGLVNAKADKPAIAAEMSAMIGKIGQSHAWAVIAGDQFQGLLNLMAGEQKLGGSAPGGESAKPLTDALAKAKAGALSLRLQGKQVKFAASVMCEDAASSKQLTGGLQMLWGLLGSAVLEKVKSQIPNLAPLATDLQKTQIKSQGELAQVAIEVNFASFAPLAKMEGNDWTDLVSSLASMANQGGKGGGLASNPPGGNPPRRPRLGGDDQSPSDSPGAKPSDDSTPEGLDEGKRAFEISGKDTDGKDFNLSDYRGKVVLLDFWGHW